MSSFEFVKSDKPQRTRKDWNQYFMGLALMAAERSTCDRAYVGCVLVNERNRVICTGYNGSVGSMDHCDDVGHAMRDGHCIATVHAEMNCIAEAAYAGKSLKNSTAYVTHFPCVHCTKLLVQSGIKKIYYAYDYRVDDFAVHILEKNNVLYEKVVLEEHR